MSKDKSQLGRYTLTKRTEAIIKTNRLEGKEGNRTDLDGSETFPFVEGSETPQSETEIVINCYDPDAEMIKRIVIQNVKNLNKSNGFNDKLISELAQAVQELDAYGSNVKTKDQIVETHKLHSERYKQKSEFFGEMKSVPREEYNKLYDEFGIDIDGRMADLKIECRDIEEDLERYYNFAKHIPGFYSLPVEDQTKLLKFSMSDFFIIIMMDAYNGDYQTFLGKNENGYHFEENADREYSRELLNVVKDAHCRWQLLALDKEEAALVVALTLVYTDRCKLKNYAQVEKMQLAITDFLRLQLQKISKSTAYRRFAKIIDALTFTREMSALLVKETNALYKDELFLKEIPFLKDFVLEDSD